MTGSAHLLHSGKAARPPPQGPPSDPMGLGIALQRQPAVLPGLDMTAPITLQLPTRHALSPLMCDQRNIS
ncbi:hypothetical protein GAY30_33630 [Azospirillum brasilense]|nr:hypothetical protein [Azospirillum brasilense]NUB36314.1 hypothetical protein [Azospirillum brasilense]RIV97300.1 hypothetical protein D2T81_29175 [Azospirillum brasilense]